MPSPDMEMLRDDLRNLETINKYFGGRSAVVGLLRKLTKTMERVRVVDLATGFGDHPRSMVRWGRAAGKEVRVMAVDRQWSTLQIARGATPQNYPVLYVQADVRYLPFKNQSADLVLCSLALHHFTEQDAIEILKESKRVAARAMACMDLIRSKSAYWAVWVLTQFILRAPMTRHDARVSVKRAFTEHELKGLARQAGWDRFWHAHLPWFRQAVGCHKD